MDGTPRLASPPHMRTEGGARLRFTASAGESRLAELWQHDPMRVLLPAPLDDALPHGVLINTSGGLVGGDRIAVEIALDDGARALVTTQAAEKVYRSAGATVEISNRLVLGVGAWLEWLPGETILFDGARLARRLRIELATDAQVMGGEIVVFGRVARGEAFAHGALSDAWELRRAGRLVWCDALAFDAAMPRTAHAFGGARAIATLVHIGRRPDAARDLLRGLLGDRRDAGVSLIGEVVVARLAMVEPHLLRRCFAQLWAALRAEAGGLPARLPSLWHG
jgi:urease accessory protein